MQPRHRAARRPVVAGVDLHRIEDVAAHPDVEPLASYVLDDRSDDREVHVGVGEIFVARTMHGIPGFRVGHRFPHRPAERNRILVVMIADRAGVREELPKRDRPVGEGGLRRLQPSYAETSLSSSSLPASTSFITPMVTTSLLTDATRTGSSGVTARPLCGSAIPSANAPISSLRSKATPASASGRGGSWIGRAGGGRKAQQRCNPFHGAITLSAFGRIRYSSGGLIEMVSPSSEMVSVDRDDPTFKLERRRAGPCRQSASGSATPGCWP